MFLAQTETEVLVIVLSVHVSAVGFQRQRSRADLHTQKTEGADRLHVHRTQVAEALEGEFVFFFVLNQIYSTELNSVSSDPHNPGGAEHQLFFFKSIVVNGFYGYWSMLNVRFRFLSTHFSS